MSVCPPMQTSPVPAFTPFRSGSTGFAYNQAAFRHFLDLERQRAQQLRRLLLLVLVNVRTETGQEATFAPTETSRVFAALGAAARDVDLVGWFRENRVMAVLMVQPSRPLDDVRRIVADRVTRALHSEFGSARPLRVRVVTLGGQSKATGAAPC